MLASESETVSKDFQVPDEERAFYRRFALVLNEVIETGDPSFDSLLKAGKARRLAAKRRPGRPHSRVRGQKQPKLRRRRRPD